MPPTWRRMAPTNPNMAPRLPKLHKTSIMMQLHARVFCHGGVAPLAAPNPSPHCHVSFTAFSACDSIHKHPSAQHWQCARMFAICPPLSRYPRHSALLQGLDHTFGLSLLLWVALSFPTILTLFKPVLRRSLTTTNASNPKGIAGVRSSTINKSTTHHFTWCWNCRTGAWTSISSVVGIMRLE